MQFLCYELKNPFCTRTSKKMQTRKLLKRKRSKRNLPPNECNLCANEKKESQVITTWLYVKNIEL